MSRKRLELLHEAIHGITRVGAIWNPNAPGEIDEWEESERAAAALGLEAVSCPLRAPEELPRVFGDAQSARIDALLVFQDQVNVRVREQITSFAQPIATPPCLSSKPGRGPADC